MAVKYTDFKMIKIGSAIAMLCMVVLLGTSSVDGRDLLDTISSRCTAHASVTAISKSEKAIIEAAGDASALACEQAPTGVALEVVATSVATAIARAIAESAAKCTSIGQAATGCAKASAQVESVGEAFSKAWASATANSASKECGCATSASTQVKAFRRVVVTADAVSESSVCTTGTAVAEAKSYVDSFVKASIKMFAEVIAEAYVGDDKCSAIADIVVEIDDPIEKYIVSDAQAKCISDTDSKCKATTEDGGIIKIEKQRECYSYSVDNGLKWDKPTNETRACSAETAVTCCRRVALDYTVSDACKECNFPLLGLSKCKSLRDCKVMGTCDC